MRKTQQFLFFILLLLTSTLGAQTKLIFAIDMVRHGDRTPLHRLPSVSDYPWEEKLGQLTAKGMEQHYYLGKKLRQYYIEETELLPQKFNTSAMYVRSTDYDRTIMSAAALLTGLYPIGTGPMENGFQPIPIHTHSLETDPILKNDTHATEFEALLAKYVFPHKQWQLKTEQTKTQWLKWSLATGWKIENLMDVIRLGNILYIYQGYKIPLPSALSKQEINAIIDISEWGMAAMYQPQEIGKYLSSAHLKIIYQYLENCTRPNTELKYVLFSGHDSSILALMSALGVPLEKAPPYASHLSIRVYENNAHNKTITVHFNDKAIALPFCQSISCEYDRFKQHINSSI